MKNKKTDLNPAAIERFVQETWDHVEHLNNIARLHPESVIRIARKRIVWPGFISRKRAFQKNNAKLMRDIQLGNDFVLTGEWQPDSSSARGAFLVHWWGTTMQKQWGLPKLTEKNKTTWFDKVWRCIIEELHIVPEKDPMLARLSGSAKTPAAMRAEIRRQTRKAFDVLIRH